VQNVFLCLTAAPNLLEKPFIVQTYQGTYRSPLNNVINLTLLVKLINKLAANHALK
jgi:hypothetical protein